MNLKEIIFLDVFFLYDVCNFDNDSRRGRKGSRKGFSRGTKLKILRVLKWSI